MSSGAEHYRMAESLLDQTDAIDARNFDTFSQYVAAREVTIAGAQVHATLALAAATVEAGGLDTWEVEETGASGDTEWGKAVRS